MVDGVVVRGSLPRHYNRGLRPDIPAGAVSRRGYGRVAVAGDSMRPGLADGDWLIVRWGATPRPGDVVVAERPGRPGMLVVKRAVRLAAGGWWLEGDNPAASHDSRLFGAVPPSAVAGVAVARYWPRPRRVGRSAGPLAP